MTGGHHLGRALRSRPSRRVCRQDEIARTITGRWNIAAEMQQAQRRKIRASSTGTVRARINANRRFTREDMAEARRLLEGSDQ